MQSLDCKPRNENFSQDSQIWPKAWLFWSTGMSDFKRPSGARLPLSILSLGGKADHSLNSGHLLVVRGILRPAGYSCLSCSHFKSTITYPQPLTILSTAFSSKVSNLTSPPEISTTKRQQLWSPNIKLVKPTHTFMGFLKYPSSRFDYSRQERVGMTVRGADSEQTTESQLVFFHPITTGCFLVASQIRNSYHSFWHFHMFFYFSFGSM